MIRTMKLFALAVVVGVLSGCPGHTPTRSESFNDIAHTAALANDALVVTANTLLNAHVLTSAQAKRVLQVTDTVHSGLSTAVAIYATGDVAAASGVLAATQGRLTTARACTTAVVPETFDACLQPAL